MSTRHFHRQRGKLPCRRPAVEKPYFPFNQPIERFRLHYRMTLAAFAGLVGISVRQYLRLVAGEPDVPSAVRQRVARRLRAPVWLINECALAPTEEQVAEVLATLASARKRGWLVVDPETLEPTGEISFEDEESDAATEPHVPEEWLRLADAYNRLVLVHGAGRNASYRTIRRYLEHRIRQSVGVNVIFPFDYLTWAQAVIRA